MTADDAPVSGRSLRLAWLVDWIHANLASANAHLVGTRSIAAFYLKQGLAAAFTRAELEEALLPDSTLRHLATDLSDDEISQGRPPPEFAKGDRVETIVNAKNIVQHIGSITDCAWQPEQGMWLFILEENGKRAGKKYSAEDLRPILNPTSRGQ